MRSCVCSFARRAPECHAVSVPPAVARSPQSRVRRTALRHGGATVGLGPGGTVLSVKAGLPMAQNSAVTPARFLALVYHDVHPGETFDYGRLGRSATMYHVSERTFRSQLDVIE